MDSALESTLLGVFAEAFGTTPTTLAQAPGRVELLGNHTDYNGGLVLAAAISRSTAVVGRPVEARRMRVVSVGFQGQNRTDEFDVDAFDPGPPGFWGRYVRGVVWAMHERFGPLNSGFEAAIAGDLPIGAGLSSSASLQGAVAMFLLRAGVIGQHGAMNQDDDALMDLARTLQRSENEFVGVGSGLLDQFSVLFGKHDHALMLDCQTLAHERLPLGNPAPAIVVCDSKTSRRLADGMYNRRREECERVVRFFQDRQGADAVRTLRDISLEQLNTHWSDLDPTGRRRARHVLTENDRVRRGAEALKAGNLAEFGRLMSASHFSSRDDFENSSPALDALIEAASTAPGFLGGKLSGAGWAGCTVNLVAADRDHDFAEAVRTSYQQRMGIEPDVHTFRAGEGAWAVER
ncbi:MAG TPA: galactokinase [Isosphaeraceae bacterium]|jgi:galactokinase|nr:galactokinase [Isosphaeraceae bacterium]